MTISCGYCMHVCVYIYIYMYVYVYTHTRAPHVALVVNSMLASAGDVRDSVSTPE